MSPVFFPGTCPDLYLWGSVAIFFGTMPCILCRQNAYLNQILSGVSNVRKLLNYVCNLIIFVVINYTIFLGYTFYFKIHISISKAFQILLCDSNALLWSKTSLPHSIFTIIYRNDKYEGNYHIFGTCYKILASQFSTLTSWDKI